MFPAMLDLSRLAVALVGIGPKAERRLALLDEARAAFVEVYAPCPSEALERRAGGRLRRRWPTQGEATRMRVVLIADGVETGLLHDLVAAARAGGALVNVEDRPELCDFHSPATVRRGDLLLTVSTGGRSPALARRLGRFLAEIFGPEWQARLEALADMRRGWRAGGADPATVGKASEAWIDRHDLLPDSAAKAALTDAARRATLSAP